MGLNELRERLDRDPEFRADFEKEYPYEAAANAIQQLRADLGWTQQDLAAHVGVPQSVIARAESGRKSFEISLLERIARGAGVRWRPLFDPAPAAAVRDLASNVIPISSRPFEVRGVATAPAPYGSSPVASLLNPDDESERVRFAGE